MLRPSPSPSPLGAASGPPAAAISAITISAILYSSHARSWASPSPLVSPRSQQYGSSSGSCCPAGPSHIGCASPCQPLPQEDVLESSSAFRPTSWRLCAALSLSWPTRTLASPSTWTLSPLDPPEPTAPPSAPPTPPRHSRGTAESAVLWEVSLPPSQGTSHPPRVWRAQHRLRLLWASLRLPLWCSNCLVRRHSSPWPWPGHSNSPRPRPQCSSLRRGPSPVRFVPWRSVGTRCMPLLLLCQLSHCPVGLQFCHPIAFQSHYPRGRCSRPRSCGRPCCRLAPSACLGCSHVVAAAVVQPPFLVAVYIAAA